MTPRPAGPAKAAAGRRARNRGRAAETLAAWFLRCKFYRILATRFRTRLGEIDIVARRGRTVVFVEVKLRRSRESAAESVDRVGRERIRRAAALYLAKHTEYTVLETRFDAIVLAPRRLPEHIEDAF